MCTTVTFRFTKFNSNGKDTKVLAAPTNGATEVHLNLLRDQPDDKLVH